jgi:hypothetical protein
MYLGRIVELGIARQSMNSLSTLIPRVFSWLLFPLAPVYDEKRSF